jgi:hypothetical protein
MCIFYVPDWLHVERLALSPEAPWPLPGAGSGAEEFATVRRQLRRKVQL